MKINFEEKFEKIESWLAKVLNYLEENFIFSIFITFILALYIRLAIIDYSSILMADFYLYIVKAIEITKGNFIPIKSHPIGWSLFYAPFYLIYKSGNLLEIMNYAKIISAFVGSLIVFPLAYLTRYISNKKTVLITLIFFVFYPALISMVDLATSENLFILLFVITLIFIYKSKYQSKYIYLAAFFASLSYYVRQQGLFILAIVLISFILLQYKKFNKEYWKLFLVVIIFFLVASPFLIQRGYYFGSPFTYGSNDKIFVDNYYQVWANNIPVVSLGEYLKNHNFVDYFNKFIVNGLLVAVYPVQESRNYTKGYPLEPLLAIFFFFGFLRYGFKRKNLPVLISFFVFLAGLAVVFSVFACPRHLYIFIPFFLIFSAIGLIEILRSNKYFNILLILFLFIFAMVSLTSYFNNQKRYLMPNWAIWAANNLQGKIAMAHSDGELIMMNLSDFTIGGYELNNYYAPQSNVRIINSGYFNTWAEAKPWFSTEGVDYFIISSNRLSMRPFLWDFLNHEKQFDFLEKIYGSYNLNINSVVQYVEIFKINYEKF